MASDNQLVKEVNLVGRVKTAILDYVNGIKTAPTKYKRVFGQSVPTTWDLQKTFTQQLKALADVAVMVGDDKALKLIQMQTQVDEKEVDDIKSKINNMKID